LRGTSELLSSIILIAITVVAFSLFFLYFEPLINNYKTSEPPSPLLERVYSYNSSMGSILILYNYSPWPIYISKVVFNEKVIPFSLSVISSNYSNISWNEIPPYSIAKLQVEANVSTITLVTQDGSAIQL
jgi:flagellin-like protein